MPKKLSQGVLPMPGVSWAMTTFSLNAKLVAKFKAACRERGRRQNWVIEQYMREFIEHPGALSRTEKEKKDGDKIAGSVRRKKTAKGSGLAAGDDTRG